MNPVVRKALLESLAAHIHQANDIIGILRTGVPGLEDKLNKLDKLPGGCVAAPPALPAESTEELLTAYKDAMANKARIAELIAKKKSKDREVREANRAANAAASVAMAKVLEDDRLARAEVKKKRKAEGPPSCGKDERKRKR